MKNITISVKAPLSLFLLFSISIQLVHAQTTLEAKDSTKNVERVITNAVTKPNEMKSNDLQNKSSVENLNIYSQSENMLQVTYQCKIGNQYKVRYKERSSNDWIPFNEWSEGMCYTMSNGEGGQRAQLDNLKCNTLYDVEVRRRWRITWHAASASTLSCSNEPCPNGGMFDSQNCHIGKAPTGTTAFIYDGNYYYTPLSSNQCPYPNSWFDSANCYVQQVPNGVSPFVYDNSWYYQAYP